MICEFIANSYDSYDKINLSQCTIPAGSGAAVLIMLDVKTIYFITVAVKINRRNTMFEDSLAGEIHVSVR